MADTSRTRAALLTLLANNSTGAISEQDLRDMLVSIMGDYGSVFCEEASTAQSSLSATPAKLTCFDEDGPANGITPAHGSDQLTIGTTSVYEVGFNGTFTGSASATFDFHFYVDGVKANKGGVEHEFTAAVEKASIAVTAILSLTAAEVLTVYVNADASSKSVTFTQAQLYARRIA